MSDLQNLLEDAVDHRVDLDVAADLRRGRSALRRRRLSVGGGIAAAVLVTGGTLSGLVGPSEPSTAPSHATNANVHAGAFEVPPPPDGWSVWRADSSYVLIAPDGTPPPQDPKIVVVGGKLGISLVSDAHGSPKAGPTIDYDGRAFYDNESPGSPTQVGYQVSPGRWLVLQEAPALHWTVHQMIAYLDGVVVTPDAVAGDYRQSRLVLARTAAESRTQRHERAFVRSDSPAQETGTASGWRPWTAVGPGVRRWCDRPLSSR